jgi:hypothetical protein
MKSCECCPTWAPCRESASATARSASRPSRTTCDWLGPGDRFSFVPSSPLLGARLHTALQSQRSVCHKIPKARSSATIFCVPLLGLDENTLSSDESYNPARAARDGWYRASARTDEKTLAGGLLQKVLRESIASLPVLLFCCLSRRFRLMKAESVVWSLLLQLVPAVHLLREPPPRGPIPRVK